jgi:hypothetical protein
LPLCAARTYRLQDQVRNENGYYLQVARDGIIYILLII